jgi:hypothetical protein
MGGLAIRHMEEVLTNSGRRGLATEQAAARPAPLILCALMAILSACAGTPHPGPSFDIVQERLQTAPPNQGQIFFFRRHAYAGSQMDMAIDLKSSRAGVLYDGSILYIDMAPGHYDFLVSTTNLISIGHAKIPIDVAPDQTYYVELFVQGGEIGLSGGGSFRLEGSPSISEDIGKTDCTMDLCGHIVSAKAAAPVVRPLTLEEGRGLR